MRKSTLEKLTQFGLEMHKLRLDLRVTQQEMAKTLGFKHAATLSDIELGKQPIVRGLIQSVADTYYITSEQREKLEEAATLSTPQLTFDLTSLTIEQRRRVMALHEELTPVETPKQGTGGMHLAA